MLYEQYEPYAELGAEVIENERSLQWIAEADVRIGFLRSFKEKSSHGKVVYGECVKVKELYEPFCPYDFLIVLYEPNICDFTDRQLYALMHHELLHVGLSEDASGNLKYQVNPHDIEDFDEIISRYGLYWSRPGAGGGG
jgi:hypothetical protein